MKQWHDILAKALNFGETRQDRTGVGTRSLFGEMLTFQNIAAYFPAVTTKKLAFKQVCAELACFIRGYDNLKQFHEMGCTIWDANGNADYWKPKARCEGDLGRIYGTRWRAWRISDFREQPTPKLRPGIPATVLGIANGKGSYRGDPLKRVWNNMLQRCYNPNTKKYPRYGGRGVFVVNEWLEFRAFSEAVKMLPGWDEAFGNRRLQLDKDQLGDGFCYGPSTCSWVTAEDNNPKPRILYTVEKAGNQFSFTNAYQFCLEHSVDPSNFSRLLNKGKYRKSANGFRLISAKSLGPTKPRYRDQLAELVAGLKADPFSRRHVVSIWNPPEDTEAVLPPCHTMFQASVRANGVLDLCVNMRSVDLFLGLPFDVASYAVLQHLLAKEVHLVPGNLVFFLGDAHIYNNHLDAVQTVLGRMPRSLPILNLADDTGLFSFRPEQATLHGYTSDGAVSAEMNV